MTDLKNCDVPVAVVRVKVEDDTGSCKSYSSAFEVRESNLQLSLAVACATDYTCRHPMGFPFQTWLSADEDNGVPLPCDPKEILSAGNIYYVFLSQIPSGARQMARFTIHAVSEDDPKTCDDFFLVQPLSVVGYYVENMMDGVGLSWDEWRLFSVQSRNSGRAPMSCSLNTSVQSQHYYVISLIPRRQLVRTWNGVDVVYSKPWCFSLEQNLRLQSVLKPRRMGPVRQGNLSSIVTTSAVVRLPIVVSYLLDNASYDSVIHLRADCTLFDAAMCALIQSQRFHGRITVAPLMMLAHATNTWLTPSDYSINIGQLFMRQPFTLGVVAVDESEEVTHPSQVLAELMLRNECPTLDLNSMRSCGQPSLCMWQVDEIEPPSEDKHLYAYHLEISGGRIKFHVLTGPEQMPVQEFLRRVAADHDLDRNEQDMATVVRVAVDTLTNEYVNVHICRQNGVISHTFLYHVLTSPVRQDGVTAFE